MKYHGNDPEHVHLKFIGSHPHTFGGVDNMRFLPLSDGPRNVILERLCEGYRRRDIRYDCQGKLGAIDDATNKVNPIVHHKQLPAEGYIYDLWRQVQLEKIQKSVDQKASVRRWLGELRSKEFSVFIDANFDNNFIFGFSSLWPKSLLRECKSICVHACMTYPIITTVSSIPLLLNILKRTTVVPLLICSRLITHQHLWGICSCL